MLCVILMGLLIDFYLLLAVLIYNEPGQIEVSCLLKVVCVRDQSLHSICFGFF